MPFEKINVQKSVNINTLSAEETQIFNLVPQESHLTNYLQFMTWQNDYKRERNTIYTQCWRAFC